MGNASRRVPARHPVMYPHDPAGGRHDPGGSRPPGPYRGRQPGGTDDPGQGRRAAGAVPRARLATPEKLPLPALGRRLTTQLDAGPRPVPPAGDAGEWQVFVLQLAAAVPLESEADRRTRDVVLGSEGLTVPLSIDVPGLTAHCESRLLIKRSLVDYPGWLAIDFGTSNSTVTLYDAGLGEEQVPVAQVGQPQANAQPDSTSSRTRSFASCSTDGCGRPPSRSCRVSPARGRLAQVPSRGPARLREETAAAGPHGFRGRWPAQRGDAPHRALPGRLPAGPMRRIINGRLDVHLPRRVCELPLRQRFRARQPRSRQ